MKKQAFFYYFQFEKNVEINFNLLYNINMEIKNLSKIKPDELYKAFALAFSDYEIQISNSQFQSMLKRRGYDPGLSFATFNDNEIVSFVLNGIGSFNGISTAYDTGTGTIMEYRGKGLAASLFEHLVPHLKKAGIKQYLLEVLQHESNSHNARAFSVLVYKSQKIVGLFVYAKTSRQFSKTKPFGSRKRKTL